MKTYARSYDVWQCGVTAFYNYFDFGTKTSIGESNLIYNVPTDKNPWNREDVDLQWDTGRIEFNLNNNEIAGYHKFSLRNYMQQTDQFLNGVGQGSENGQGGGQRAGGLKWCGRGPLFFLGFLRVPWATLGLAERADGRVAVDLLVARQARLHRRRLLPAGRLFVRVHAIRSPGPQLTTMSGLSL